MNYNNTISKIHLSNNYLFTPESIEQHVYPGVFGNYILYNSIQNQYYTGRSNDLKRRLSDHHRTRDKGYFDLFRFQYAQNSTEAYNRECFLYHYLQQNGYMRNEIHPAKPYPSIRCEFCGE